jgi:hypothetical protein
MDCKDVDRLLTDYLEGELAPQDTELLEQHLAACRQCRGELEIRRKMRESLAQSLILSTSRIEPPSGSWERITEKAGINKEHQKKLPRKLNMAIFTAPLSICLLVILALGLLSMMSGMSPPPPGSPLLVNDGSGGTFVFWVDSPYYSSEGLYGQHIDAGGALRWGENKLISSEKCEPLTVSDGSGGVILACGDGNGIYARRLDAQGNPVWQKDKVIVCPMPENGWQSLLSMVEDGEGGAIVVCLSSEQVFAQKINGDGVCLWGENGVPIGNIKLAYRGMPAVSDGDGGIVLLWEDSTIIREASPVSINGLFAQRINGEGKILWEPDGVKIASDSTEKERPKLVNDGTNNFILTWTEIVTSGTWDEDVYVQKLDADGNVLWGDKGILVCDNPEMQSDSQITGDGAGGCIVTWLQGGLTGTKSVMAQRFDADGEPMWTDEGVLLWQEDEASPNYGKSDLSIIGDGEGNSIIIWRATAGNHRITSMSMYAQKVSPLGQKIFSGDGVNIFEQPYFRNIGYSAVTGDGSGGFIMGSRVGIGGSMNMADSVQIQRLNADGNRLWGESGLALQVKRPSPVLPVIAALIILITALVLLAVFKGGPAGKILVSVVPVIIGIVALFCFFLLIGPLGYSYSWAYVLKTPADIIATAIVPIAGLVIAGIGIHRRTVSKWILIPVLVFIALVAFIVGFLIFIFFIR